MTCRLMVEVTLTYLLSLSGCADMCLCPYLSHPPRVSCFALHFPFSSSSDAPSSHFAITMYVSCLSLLTRILSLLGCSLAPSPTVIPQTLHCHPYPTAIQSISFSQVGLCCVSGQTFTLSSQHGLSYIRLQVHRALPAPSSTIRLPWIACIGRGPRSPGSAPLPSNPCLHSYHPSPSPRSDLSRLFTYLPGTCTIAPAPHPTYLLIDIPLPLACLVFPVQH